MQEPTASQSSHRSNRLEFIDLLQTIGIILVVLGHSFHQYPGGHNGSELLIYKLCYSFHMPLFLFVSGFLLLYTTRLSGRQEESLQAFTLKKGKRLLIPFATLTLVTFIPRTMLSNMADTPMEFSISSMLGTLIFTEQLPIPYFWFIQTDFLLLMLAFATLFAARKAGIEAAPTMGVLTLLFLITPYCPNIEPNVFGFNEMLNLGIYFMLGADCCLLYGRTGRRLDMGRWWVVVLCTAIWLGAFFIFGHSWMPTARMCVALPGIAMCTALAQTLARSKIKFLSHLSGASYIIFLLSWYFNVLAQQILAHYVSLPWWVHTLLSLLLGIYMPWLIFRYLRRHSSSRVGSISAFLLGQKI